MLPARDIELVQIVDAAVADAARRSGPHLLCGPGCTQCCMGVFPISQLDAARLRAGLASLDSEDPRRAAAVRLRAQQSIERIASEFPGDPATGILDEARSDLLEDFANDEPCPALDPATGLCDLYAARPITCRVFGPPLAVEGGIGVCELCYREATEQEIAACAVHLESANPDSTNSESTDPDSANPESANPGSADLESSLVAEAEQSSGVSGETIVAFALALPRFALPRFALPSRAAESGS